MSQTSQQLCPNCQTNIEPEQSTCPQCGTPLVTETAEEDTDTLPPSPPTPATQHTIALWHIALATLLVLALLSTGLFALFKGSSSRPTTHFPSTQTLHNLSIVYVGDKLTFTSIQQASQFTDDALTYYAVHPNYVRIFFQEESLASDGLSYPYIHTFHLILPDKKIVDAQAVKDITDLDKDELRLNWIDFPADSTLDLHALTLHIGDANEDPMDIPLHSDANLSQYQPKTINPNLSFTYNAATWTLQNVTRSAYFNNRQARTGFTFITVYLRADNPSPKDIWQPGTFCHLIAGNMIVSPDSSSDSIHLVHLSPSTMGHYGSEVFYVKLSPIGLYTLLFQPNLGQHLIGQAIDFQIK